MPSGLRKKRLRPTRRGNTERNRALDSDPLGVGHSLGNAMESTSHYIGERGGIMRELSDESLIEVYRKAVQYHLDKEFIDLILEEMIRRKLYLPKEQNNMASPDPSSEGEPDRLS
ncbi:conserved hypothetical protein [[Clostridium] ultunense Esp]|nr:conserved hypothetical protein [[Clostridium] ultunense Esp]